MEVIQAWGDKMADKKISDLICSVLTALSESVSPGFVVKQMKRVIDKTRAPLAHQNFLDWLKVRGMLILRYFCEVLVLS